MENNSSNNNLDENNEGDYFYKQYIGDLSSGNIDFQLIKIIDNTPVLEDNRTKKPHNLENVAEKVEGGEAISKRHPSGSSCQDHPSSSSGVACESKAVEGTSISTRGRTPNGLGGDGSSSMAYADKGFTGTGLASSGFGGEASSSSGCSEGNGLGGDGTVNDRNTDEHHIEGNNADRFSATDDGSRIDNIENDVANKSIESRGYDESVDCNYGANDDEPFDSKVSDTLDPESLVRDLETHLQRKLSKKPRQVMLLAAAINLGKGIGITVKHLQSHGFGEAYAEKLLRELSGADFLAEMDKRSGHMKQYCLPNYLHVLLTKANNPKEEILPNDITLLVAKELGALAYGYHNIGLETSLNYKEDYELIRWPILSHLNKQKVQTYRLDTIRSCTFTLSTTGKLNMDIQCTHRPYFFHTSSGLLDLFTGCGQIYSLLQISANNRLNVVPRIGDWYLTHFDYNKDLHVKGLKNKYDMIASWSSKGLLKIEYLATIFQAYCKPVPFDGECLRFEGHYRAKGEEKERLENMVAKLANKDMHPFTTLEEMLLDQRNRME